MALDVLVPALAGYLFLRRTHLTWLSLTREFGYHLVFQSALAGLGFYVVGWILGEKLKAMPAFLTKAVPAFLTTEEGGGVLGLGLAELWTLAVVLVATWVCNTAWPPAKAERLAVARSTDTLARLVDRAGKEDRTIALSLKGGKEYIGYVIEGGIQKQTGEEGGLVVLPVLSGYRDQETQELVITTGYAEVLGKMKNPLDLTVAIPRSEIARARLFDLMLYTKEDFQVPPGVRGESVEAEGKRTD